MATELTITPDFVDKTATLVGVVAVGEQVALTVVGAGGGIAGLRVRLRYAGVEVARFPLADEDAFTATGAGTDAIGTIDLNTVELRAAFDGQDDNAKLPCTLLVEFNGDEDNLYAVAKIQVRNWPAIPADQVPVSVATWVDDLAALQSDVDALDTAFEAASFRSHTHADAGEGGIVAHGSLSETGTNTHAQIDAAITSLGSAMNAYAGAVTAHKADTANPHSVTKAQVSLGNVDNTSDLSKPISTATQAALDLKIEASHLAAHTVLTNNPHLVTKAQVGLGNVDNTSDAAKPVSDATAAAIALHANSESDPHGTLNTLGQLFADVDAATATLAELRARFAQVVGILKGLSA